MKSKLQTKGLTCNICKLAPAVKNVIVLELTCPIPVCYKCLRMRNQSGDNQLYLALNLINEKVETVSTYMVNKIDQIEKVLAKKTKK